MLEIQQRLGLNIKQTPDATLVLNHEQRERGRMLLTSTDNEEIRLFLTRGQPLLVGEYLQSNCKKLIQIEGAQESVAVGRCKDWQTFARACYHLGNRHVKVQVDALCLMIKPDHVLEKMLMIQGLEITHEEKIFIPESGAYQQDKHAH